MREQEVSTQGCLRPPEPEAITSLVLHEFVGANIPPYTILSHTWGPAEEEVSFRDMRQDRDAAVKKAGYSKIQKCCLKASQEGHQYVWIDTCCIDKRSSAELSEAINSMYKWYFSAQVCYVYLEDVPSRSPDASLDEIDDALSKSRWFTRGWTLQELIAPGYCRYFAKDWILIGTKGKPQGPSQGNSEDRTSEHFVSTLCKITGIYPRILRNPRFLSSASVAEGMSFASRRQTVRDEDVAYSLMGLFGVHMPILYGEGKEKAFERLQLEIIKSSSDQTIFAWVANRGC
jgi:hypothetical protein